MLEMNRSQPDVQLSTEVFSSMKEVGRFLLGIGCQIAVAQVFDSSAYEGPNLLERDLDKYLAQLAIWSEADICIVRKDLLPGHLEFAQSLGFGSQAIQVDTNADPLRDPGLQKYLESNGAVLITPFYESGYPKNALDHLGKRGVQKISSLANSKSHLHTVGKEMGVPLFDGGVGKTMSEIEKVAASLQYPLWLKIDGSGSDFVIKINQDSQLSEAVHKLISGLLGGWRLWEAEFKPENMEEINWGEFKNFDQIDLNKNKDLQLPVPVILEQDASCVGTFKYNLCISGVLSHNDFAMACISSQVVGENGEWWGSQKADLETEVVSLIQEKIQALLAYWRSLGYAGPVGPDCIVYENNQGELDLGWIDPNARNPISMVPELIGNKLNLPVWRNTNISSPEPITDFNQLRPLINSIESQLLNCKVVPLAFRSTKAKPSQVCKLAIFTDNQKLLDQAFAILKRQVIIGS